MPRPSQNFTYQTRLRLTEDEHRKLTELQGWYRKRPGEGDGGLSVNDTFRRALGVAHERMLDTQRRIAAASRPEPPAPPRETPDVPVLADPRSVVARAAAALPKSRRKFNPEAPAEHIEGQTAIDVPAAAG